MVSTLGFTDAMVNSDNEMGIGGGARVVTGQRSWVGGKVTSQFRCACWNFFTPSAVT